MNWIEEKKWQEILKNKLISVPKQKTHIRKPKSGTDMDKCKDKLVQLNEKLKNMDLSYTFDTIEASNEKIAELEEQLAEQNRLRVEQNLQPIVVTDMKQTSVNQVSTGNTVSIQKETKKQDFVNYDNVAYDY